MDRTELERMDREGLVLRAQAAGIRRARLLTRPELIDELLRLDPVIDEAQLSRTRGFFGRARDLLSRVVERGLHLPDAADRLRVALGDPLPHVPRPEHQAVPTVTLAEIYAAQGHKQRALETLRRVLEAEPEHRAARSLLERLEAEDYVPPPPPLPPEPDVEGPPRVDELVDARGVEPRSLVEAQAVAHPAHATMELDEPPTLRRPSPTGGESSAEVELPRSECLAIPASDSAWFVWWRVAAAQALPPGMFLVRAVILTPTWGGPELELRDVPCDVRAGEIALRDLPARAVVRVAIGCLEGEAFTPIAHSPAFESTPSGGLVRWTLEGRSEVALDDTRSSSIALAVERAARLLA